MQSKAPNNYNVNVVRLNPLGMEALPGRVLVGNALIELGLVMGAFNAHDMLKVPFGEAVPVQEQHAKEWRAVCRGDMSLVPSAWLRGECLGARWCATCRRGSS